VDAPAIHEMLAFLLNNLPPAMHLVLITRADLPLPLDRLSLATSWPRSGPTICRMEGLE
jgi:ATP/maltotriose-dependent transcriptional regulator MalT